MNRRYCAAIGLICLLSLCAARVRAQPAAPGGAANLPPTVYADPESAGSVASIKAYLSTHVAALVNDTDPAAQSKARDFLVQVCIENKVPAQPPFLYVYAKALDGMFMEKLGGKTTMRQKLNVAIVTSRVAAIAQNGALQNTAKKLIEDNAEPVVLWGMKAAQSLVKDVVKLKGPGGAPAPLIAAIGPAVSKHPSGPIFDEAYQALGSVADPLTYGELVKLWENRLEQYRKGIPDDPSADGSAVLKVTDAKMWSTVLVQKPAQDQAMQMICDQISMAAQHADAAAVGDTKDQLANLTKQCAQGAQVVGLNRKLDDLVTASTQLARFNVGAMNANTKLVPLAAPVIAEIRRAFPAVNAPPTIAGQGAGAGVAQP